MFFFYFMLLLGALLTVGAVVAVAFMASNKNYPLLNVGKSLLSFLIGVLLFWITLPSLKYVLFKDYDVVSGSCVIEMHATNRNRTADFRMLDTDETYSYLDIPELDAYGKAVPYYCELTLTKDHMFEVGYRIYDSETRELIRTSD